MVDVVAKKEINNLTLLTKVQIAEAFKVSLNTITSWVRKGCPFETKGRNGKSWTFDLSKVVDWRVLQLLKESSREVTGVSLLEAKRRKSIAEAALKELEISVAQGKHVLSEEAGRFWEKHISDCRARMLSIPSKLAPQVVGCSISEAKEIIEHAVHEALTELSGKASTGKTHRRKIKSVGATTEVDNIRMGRSGKKA